MSARPWRVEIRTNRGGAYVFDCTCATREKAEEIARRESEYRGYGARLVNRDTAEVIHL